MRADETLETGDLDGYPAIGLEDVEPLREDWFPVVWRQGDGAG